MIAQQNTLLELYYSIKNTLQSPAFLGNALLLLVEELELMLDVPLILINFPSLVISNALEEEYTLIKKREKRTIQSEKNITINNPIISNCIAVKERIESLVYTERDMMRTPLRRMFRKLGGLLTLNLEYTPGIDFVNKMQVYFNKSQFEHLDQDRKCFLNTQELAICITDCLAEVFDYQQAFHRRQDAMGSKVSPISRYDPAFFPYILSDTKKIVEQLLPEIHSGFREVVENRMLLQFFIIEKSDPENRILKYIPTEDQVLRFNDVASQTVHALKKWKLESFIEGHESPLSFLRHYKWDKRRSFTGYSCATGCFVYSISFYNEHLIKGNHLSDKEQKERETASIIMQMAQGHIEWQNPVQLTIPWFIGRELFGALQINATEELPIEVIREAIKTVQGIFNVSEFDLRQSEIMGKVEAVKQIRAHLIMLEHDVPQFLSRPISNTIQHIQGLIEDHLHKPSRIPKESVIENISNRMAQLATLSTHYEVFLRSLMGAGRFQETGGLTNNEDFEFDECINNVKRVFDTLVRQKELTVDKGFIPYLTHIELKTETSKLNKAVIIGVKSLLVEIILNLLHNSLRAITIHNKDRTRNPLCIDPNRGIIGLTILPVGISNKPFLKISIEDRGAGIAEDKLHKIRLKIDEYKQHMSKNADFKSDQIIQGMSLISGGRKRYGLTIIFEILKLLSREDRFRLPEITSKEFKGTKIEIWYPVESIKF